MDLCEWIDPTSLVWELGNYEKSTFGQPIKKVADGKWSLCFSLILLVDMINRTID